MSAQQIYGLLLLSVLHGGLALWVYNDIKRRELSIFWVLGTLLMPEAFFPLYFWKIKPDLIWVCPVCSSKNKAWSRKCRHCERLYTTEETAERLHGYFEPSDAFVIFLVVLLAQRFGLYLAIMITNGSKALRDGVDIASLSHSHLWIVELIGTNVLIWLCVHCITVRYRRPLASVGLQFKVNFRLILLPLLLAPLLFLISEATVRGLSLFSRLTSLTTLEDLIQWEQGQQSAYMPAQLDTSIILIIFVSLFLSPFAEEILFRGIAYPALSHRFGQSRGIFLSALFFAVSHGGAIQLIPSFVLGVVLALLFHRTRSLIPSIMTHSLVNLISLVMWFGNG